eukprot:scaffold13560_cov122-Alexandrium_tamarense.AAC.6
MSSSPCQRIRTITLLLSPKRGVEGGLLKKAARKETEENFMLVEVESICVVCVCLVDERLPEEKQPISTPNHLNEWICCCQCWKDHCGGPFLFFPPRKCSSQTNLKSMKWSV